MTITVAGPVHTFGLTPEKKRRYLVVTLPYRQAREVFKSELYTASSGKGEQREIVSSHANKLRDEIRKGNFTPRTITAGTRGRHRKAVEYDPAHKNASLKVADSLPLTDGGHEMEAIGRLVKEGVEAALDLDITALIMLDGDTQKDFLNLQLGKQVERAHMLSMKVQQAMVRSKDHATLKLAIDVGRMLNGHEESPFLKQIRFDSRGSAGLPISTLCSTGSSDIASSLVGLARIGLLNNSLEDAAPFLANAVVSCYKALQADAPELLKPGMVLTPPPDGTKGAATMLVGLGTLMAFRLDALDRTVPTEDDIKLLVKAAKNNLDEKVSGNFSGPTKRHLLGEFAVEFLSDVKGDSHAAIPLKLVETLSASSLGVKPLPRKPRVAKKKAAKREQAAPVAESTGNDSAPTPSTAVAAAPAEVVVEVKMKSAKEIGDEINSKLEGLVAKEVEGLVAKEVPPVTESPTVTVEEKPDGGLVAPTIDGLNALSSVIIPGSGDMPAPWEGDGAAPWEVESDA